MENEVRKDDVHPNVQALVQNNQLFPPAEEIDLSTGKGKWTIKGYRIWADNYLQACKHLEMIENF